MAGIFYQKFLDVVGMAEIKEVQRVFETVIVAEGWNHTQLSLIPKINNPTRMLDMRSISLCAVQYKIVSKILTILQPFWIKKFG